MPHFRLVSATDTQRSIELEGMNAAAALDVAVRNGMRETDVWQDGSYIFTAQHNASGIWMISRHQPASEMPPAQSCLKAEPA